MSPDELEAVVYAITGRQGMAAIQYRGNS
jgi:hypothetical protein